MVLKTKESSTSHKVQLYQLIFFFLGQIIIGDHQITKMLALFLNRICVPQLALCGWYLLSWWTDAMNITLCGTGCGATILTTIPKYNQLYN